MEKREGLIYCPSFLFTSIQKTKSINIYKGHKMKPMTIKTIDSKFPLLFLLCKGRNFTVETNIDKEEMANRLMQGKVSLSILQKDQRFIGISVDGIKSFDEFFKFTGIKVNSSSIAKASKVLRRCFSENMGGAAAFSNSFNFKHITKEENAQHYNGDKDTLGKCFDGCLYADPLILSKIWQQPVYEHDSFVGTIINKGIYSKGLITARKLADGLDLVTYDTKSAVVFPEWVSYIHLMSRVKPCPVMKTGDAVCFRNPNGSNKEHLILNLVESGYQPMPNNKLSLSALDIQSLINFDLFRFLPQLVEDYLDGILSKLNSDGIRELLGGLHPTTEVNDDSWLLNTVLQNTSIDIRNYPGLLRKTQTLFRSSLEKLNIFALKEGQKFQVPNNTFARAYLVPDSTSVDENGIYKGNNRGDLKQGQASINKGNLYINVADPEKTAHWLATIGGADFDGDSVLLSVNNKIINHIKSLPKIGNETFSVQVSQSSVSKFSKHLKKHEPQYNEFAFLKLINEGGTLNLGSSINKYMMLFQVSKDKHDTAMLQKLTPCLNSIEALIDACIGQGDDSIHAILNRLNELMLQVKEVPDFMQLRFVSSVTGEPRYPSYVSPDSKWFHEINKLVNDFNTVFCQMQSEPAIDINLFKPVSNAMAKYAQVAMFRYKTAIQDALKSGETLDLAYSKGVGEIKGIYGTLNEDEKLELTASLINRVYLRPTPEYVKSGEKPYPDSILYVIYEDEGKMAGSGSEMLKLLTANSGIKVATANINYDALINGEVKVAMQNGRIIYNGCTIGTAEPNQSDLTLKKSGKRFYLIEAIQKAITWRENGLIPVYSYRMPSNIKLHELIKLKAINIQNDAGFSYFNFNNNKIFVSSKVNEVLHNKQYAVLDSYVSKTGKSVEFLLK
jgi:hypothetical protein